MGQRSVPRYGRRRWQVLSLEQVAGRLEPWLFVIARAGCTVTTFGTAVDVTVAELSIEAFLPADDATARAVALLVADDVRSREVAV